MTMIITAVRDRKAGYLQPNVNQNTSIAIREFLTMCDNSFPEDYAFISDYELYKIGEYDTESGKIRAEEEPIFLCTADRSE